MVSGSVEKDGVIEIEAVAWKQRERLERGLEYSKLVELVMQKRAVVFFVTAVTAATFALISATFIGLLSSELLSRSVLGRIVESETTWWILLAGTLGGGTLAIWCLVRGRLIKSERDQLELAQRGGKETLSLLDNALSDLQEVS